MELKITPQSEEVEDVICDVCKDSTRISGYGLQYGTLQAKWGYGSCHDGERYLVHLCEPCFFMVISTLRRQRMVNTMFDEANEDLENFGRVSHDDFWNER